MRDIENLKSRLVKPMPLLVHCSAGIGRSGVLIMLEIGFALFQQEKSVDMAAVLTQMRAQRMGMVQTKVCLACHVKGAGRLVVVAVWVHGIGEQTCNGAGVHRCKRLFPQG